MLKHSGKQHSYLVLFFVMLIAGCSGSDSGPTDTAASSQQHEVLVDVMSDESADSSEIANSNSTAENSNDGSDLTDSVLMSEIASDLFSDELIDPLLADIQPGSALSATNYPTFLSAYYRLVGSQLLQTITLNIDAVSIEIRAALAGETTRFVAESVAGPETDNTLQAVLACPGGGRVSVTLSTGPLENATLFTEAIYGDYRDSLSYDNCSVDGISYNGITTEHHTTVFQSRVGRTASRRFGGFVYSGGSTGANQFTNHPVGFGDAEDRFTISSSRGMSAVLYTQQSQIYLSSKPEPLQRWHGNWQLLQDDRSMTMEKMNITVVKSSTGRDAVYTSVAPYFTLTGNVTNGRTIKVVNQAGVAGVEEDRSLLSGKQVLSDAEGGILDLTVERAQPDRPERNIVLRLDTEGQILNPVLPVGDEALLMIQ